MTTRQIIEEFLNSSNKELKLSMIPIDDVDNIMSELNFLDCGDFETNGWQCDFWKSYTNNKYIISFRGSLYYGNFILEKQ